MLTDEQIDELILAIRIRTHVNAGSAFVDRHEIERNIYKAAVLHTLEEIDSFNGSYDSPAFIDLLEKLKGPKPL